MKVQTFQPDKIVDLRGLRCPNLLIATIKALQTLAPEQTLQITANDPNAPHNLTSWCQQSGHTLLAIHNEADTFVINLQKNAESQP